MKFNDLFDQEQLEAIKNAPEFIGSKHPTWFPLYAEKKRAIDYLVNSAVQKISQEKNGQSWLSDLNTSLTNQVDISNASSALAELRAYGGLLEAGFVITPIPRRDDSTPDFHIDAGDGKIIVEVFAKHQDKDQDDLINAAHLRRENLPNGVERISRKFENGTITTTIIELNPAGSPDPDKEVDSIQANMISRVCAIKQKEIQIPEDHPSLLIMDFAHFGGPYGSLFLQAPQIAPIESGHNGITCGSIWYALYGWICWQDEGSRYDENVLAISAHPY